MNMANGKLVNNENVFITDKYNTRGKLIRITNLLNDLDDLYIFQPIA